MRVYQGEEDEGHNYFGKQDNAQRIFTKSK